MQKEKKPLKCPWCGKMVGFSKAQRIEPHLQGNRVKCWGVGQPREQVEALRDMMKARA